MTSEIVRAAARAIADLDGFRTVLLMTYPPGEPHGRLRSMGFVHQGWRVYLSALRSSRKSREIASNPRVSVIAQDSTRPRGHFIQIDGEAIEQVGDAFDEWQDRRYRKEGDRLRAPTQALPREAWIGWCVEPVRVRLNGYWPSGTWYEKPLVLSSTDLAGLSAGGDLRYRLDPTLRCDPIP